MCMRAYTGRERGSKKNVILSRPLSLPHSEHPTVCLPWRSSDISRKASGPGNREVSDSDMALVQLVLTSQVLSLRLIVVG